MSQLQTATDDVTN